METYKANYNPIAAKRLRMLTGIFDNSGGKKREATSSNIAVQCCIQQKKKSSFRISSKRKREKKKKANKLLHVTVKRVRKAGTATVSYVTLFPSVFCHPLFPSFISTKIKFFRSNGKKKRRKKNTPALLTVHHLQLF